MILLFSCRKGKEENTVTTFSDGFENAVFFNDLFPSDLTRFTGSQLVEIHNENKMRLDTLIVHSGNNSLRCEARTTTGNYVSKASIFKHNLDLREGDVVYVSVWYYLTPTVNSTDADLYICDLEETAQTGGSPGFRIRLGGDPGRLEVERGKIGQSTLYQPAGNEIVFPQGQWVHLEYEAKLSQKKKGYIKLWQDGILLIDEKDIRLLGKDKLFALHGTTGSVDRLEVGATANGSGIDQVIYVDDVFVQKKN